jgi:hypothetical protein
MILLVFEGVAYYLLSDSRATLQQSSVPLATVLQSHGVMNEGYVHEFLPSFPKSTRTECKSSLKEHEVTFSLTLALTSEQRLPSIGHHCKRWGIGATISAAVWTCLSAENVLDMLLSMEANKHCRRDQLIITTLWSPPSSSSSLLGVNSSNATQMGDNFTLFERQCSQSSPAPMNRLRNLAIQAAAKTTTHVVPIDIGMWPSENLYDSLNAPRVIKALAKDPQLALVIPAFETDEEILCQNVACKNHHRIPRSFDDLILLISDRLVVPMNSLEYDRQGSTNYRQWINQSTGHLKKIPCLTSSAYRPVVAVRNCGGSTLPPFPQRTSHGRLSSDDNSLPPDHDDNVATWIVHLVKRGYSFQQLGGSFVVSLITSEMNNSKTIEPIAGLSLHAKEESNSSFVADFNQWLEATVPDSSVIKMCDIESG